MLPVDSSITFLKVKDIERSARFYENGLGLVMVLDQGGCRIYKLTDEAFIGVCERDADPASNIIFTFVTDDVDGWHQRITAGGVETDGEPRDNADYRIYHFFVTDPDGHTLEFQRFWDHDWDQP